MLISLSKPAIDEVLTHILYVLAAYLIGSLSSAVIVCRLFSLPDPREHGSNNPGATNVLRLGGKKPAALTLVGDMLKGLLPAMLTVALGAPPIIVTLVALAAFAGHLFPVFFNFRGGKGVATALGALLGAAWVPGVLAIVTWLAVCLLCRISSVAALATFTLVPLYLYAQGQKTQAMGFIVIAVLLFFTHRSNLKRLLQGVEPRVGSSKT